MLVVEKVAGVLSQEVGGGESSMCVAVVGTTGSGNYVQEFFLTVFYVFFTPPIYN